MERRAIMVDVDGVLIAHPHAAGWTATLERDLGIAPAALQRAFFAPHWDDVVHGRAALRSRLAPVLAALAPSVGYERFVSYWFDNDAHVNHALLAELARLRADGAELHLATVQEHERARYLWELLDFRRHFDGMHYAAALGCSKPDARFYRLVEEATGLDPAAIFFIDDKPANVAGARDCGWTAALWTGAETLHALIARHGWRVG